MAAHLPVAVELNGWRYEATYAPETKTWKVKRTSLNNCSRVHDSGYTTGMYDVPSDGMPEMILQHIYTQAVTECTLY